MKPSADARKKSKNPAGVSPSPSMQASDKGFLSNFPWRHPLLPLLLILVAGLYAYWNTFNVPFVFDDQSSIVDNSIIKDLGNFLGDSKGYLHNPRRVVGYFSFALNYHWGGLDVFGYHLVNLVIHLVNALLVYTLCRQLFRTPYLRQSTLAPGATGVALLAALLFIAHPLQTQAVTYIVQRFTSLTILFFLLSFVLYTAGRLRCANDDAYRSPHPDSLMPDSESRILLPSRLFTFLLFAGSLLAAVLAMKTKEMAFTLPLTILLCEFSFFKSSLKTKLLAGIPVLLTLAIVPLSLLGSNKPLAELLADVDRITRETAHIPRFDYLLTQFTVIATYLRLLIFPVQQNLDYDYPLYHTFFTPPVFFSFSLLLGLLALAVYLYGFRFPNPESRVPNPESRLIAFGIFWFFITLAVESSLIPIRDIIFEHRLYLPSCGAFLALSTTAALLGRKLSPKTFWSIAALLILILATASWQRNQVWRDEISLWQDTAEKSPDKPRPHYNLGKALLSAGATEAALSSINRALQLDPENVEAHNNLGAAFDRQGWTEQAIVEFNIALQLQPRYAIARTNLGIALEKLGRIEEAAQQYRLAAQDNPDYFPARFNLGTALFSQGLAEEAIHEYQTAVRLDPGHAEARMNLAVAYDAAGRLELAVAAYHQALLLNPDNAQAFNNLGVILQKQGRLTQAIEQYQAGLRLNPENARTHGNLGTAWLALENPTLAADHFRAALRLDPENVDYAGLLEHASQQAAQRDR
jgi:Flp pilus assembly protein TadD